MSQVSRVPLKISFERLVSESEHVLVVRNLGKPVLVFQATLPRETHYEKSSETRHEEWATPYRIVRVLKSGSLIPGEEIKVWREPAYDFESMKRYHTTGESESPAILSYEPAYPSQGGESILFLTGRSEPRDSWIQYLDAEEGLAAEKEILAALDAPPPARGVLPT